MDVTRVDADEDAAGWVGTYRAPDGRVAIVTTIAPTRERAVAAAVRWATREDTRTYIWHQCRSSPRRYTVFYETRLGRQKVPLENG